MESLEKPIVEHFLEGQLCGDEMHNLRPKLLDYAEGRSPQIILNFERVEYMDSSFLSVLVQLGRKVRRHNGLVRLVGMRPHIRTMMHMLHLDLVYPISEDTPLTGSATPRAPES